jgi:putative transposase
MRHTEGFFRRVKKGGKVGFPRFRGKGWFDSFGFTQFVGIFLKIGISTFAALSDGGFIPSLRAARKAERRLRVTQRALARAIRGSGARGKARTVVARCHAAVTRQRTEHLHQASARLVRDYDAIAIEKLNVKGLAAGALAKDVHDASWARFISMLTYKAAKAGTRLIEVDPRNTSQDCSGCGVKVPKELDDRSHDCPHCGLSIDRDLNAARNVLNRAGVGPGLRNVAGYGMRAGENLYLAPAHGQEGTVPY